MENVLEVSNQIWNAFLDNNPDALVDLAHQDALFVHMGVTQSRDGEIEIIKKGVITCKEVDFQEKTIKEMDSTIILLNKLRLTAVVNGEEVTNPFVVTEVYTKNESTLKLASMSYTKINY